MARQCWDEARHCEISREAVATGWAPRSASSPRSTFLYEAACNPDPVLRLTGVNRALEGLAIDVFNTMREFGDIAGDPVLEFCEDWMLADEVTHVKMGSDWLRRLTANDPERREQRARVPAHRRQAVLASAASAARTTTARSSSPAASASSPASPPTRSTSSPSISTRPARGRAPRRPPRAKAAAAELSATVTVTPESFTLVDFDARAASPRVTEQLARRDRSRPPSDVDRGRRDDAARPGEGRRRIDPIVLSTSRAARSRTRSDPRQLRRAATADVARPAAVPGARPARPRLRRRRRPTTT